MNLDLTGAVLIDLDLSRCRVHHATFTRAKFSLECLVRQAVFGSNAQFDGAVFGADASLSRAKFGGVTGIDGAEFAMEVPAEVVSYLASRSDAQSSCDQ
ncbi:pentapeptide repeat-containing protein [Amycolatopsis sp. CA-126428]|uniref:pentapeptide repeat-containing protein n=1 Tax=Amycolatopsis sp. CA-126428 TaxID=2073158 RepID=UPI000CD03251|nr:pentapeptide repeat-containing protein [Amycolatopsis sp. CA-126428]